MHGGAHTGQLLGRDAGVLERFVGDLQHQPLLGVHGFGFTRRDAEVVGVEAGDVGQEAAPLGRHPAGRELVRVVELVGVPAVRRDLADPVAAVGQEVPVALRASAPPGKRQPIPTTAIGSAAAIRDALSNCCVSASRLSSDIAETLSKIVAIRKYRFHCSPKPTPRCRTSHPTRCAPVRPLNRRNLPPARLEVQADRPHKSPARRSSDG